MNAEHDDSRQWLLQLRRRTLMRLLSSLVGLGFVGLVYSLIRAGLGSGDRYTLIPYLAAYAIVLALFFIRPLPDNWRAAGFVVLVYAFACFSLYAAWLAGGGRHFLLATIVLAAVLIGPRAGFMAAGISLATYAAFGLGFTLGWLHLRTLAAATAIPVVITEGIGFSMAVGLIAIGLWFIQRGFTAVTQANEEAFSARLALAEHAQQLDEANRLLAERSASLELANHELELQVWHAHAQARLVDTLRGVTDLQALAERALRQVCRTSNANVGVLYLLEDHTTLRPIAHYALPPESDSATIYKLGEGPVGQAALSGRPLHLTHLLYETTQQFPHITSGLGEAQPGSLLTVPLLDGGETRGVLELAALGDFLPAALDYVNGAAEKIANALGVALERTRMAEQSANNAARYAEDLAAATDPDHWRASQS